MGDGKFKPGDDPRRNASGRPKIYRTVVDLARKRTVRALKTLTEIMEDATADAGARVKAASVLLDRGWGKAPQTLNINTAQKKPREMSLEEIERRLAELQGGEMPTNTEQH